MPKKMIWLIAIASLIKIVLALQLELGNDEVYYWTYACYPDFSHFDHPPMVGWLAQLFTLNLFFHDDFFLRLGPVVLAAVDTWLIYRIGLQIKNEQTGWYAALLFTSSIYCSIIGGFALTPDASLIFFWLLALMILLDILPKTTITKFDRRKIIGFGIIAGLAMLSKYQGAFLWLGTILYVILFNRKWLLDYSFYLAGIISALVLTPILIWNFQNEFISFTFHSQRVAPTIGLRPDYFITEIVGQILYNNPINYVLIVIAFIAIFKRKHFILNDRFRILMCIGLPLWLLFTGFSLFRSTLPHWSAPAYFSFLLIAACYWSQRAYEKQWHLKPWAALSPLKSASYFLGTLLLIALFIIRYSPFQLGRTAEVAQFGEDDFTQDMYGWDQIENAFEKIAKREEASGAMPSNAGLISYRWFPGAHEDFYIAQPTNRELFLLGNMEEIHKYAWIDKERGGLQTHADYYHIAVSNLYDDPSARYGEYFNSVEPLDTVAVTRAGVIMRYAFFYKLKSYKGNFVNPLTQP